MTDTAPEFIYKVAAAGEFEAAQAEGIYPGAEIDLTDGFIHFSTAAQLPETLRRHFRGRRDLLLAAIRTAEIDKALRWEPSRGGDLFPHLYADLPMQAVAWTSPIEVDDEGRCNLPARLG